MQSPLVLLALLSPLALAATALLALAERGPRPRRLERALTGASLVGPLVAAALVGLVSTRGPLVSPLLGAQGFGLSLRLDPLSVMLFTMIALLAVVLVRFSRTYLDGDARQGVFLGRLAATIAAVQILVLSGNLVLFVAAWVATSLTLHQLLLFYPDRRGARVAAKKKFIAARIGDLCLAGAATLLALRFGTGDLGAILEAATRASAGLDLEVAALLLAVAALFKSAQFPTHGWLVEVMETPTPVSALLHAGILNAGPFLIVRFAQVVEIGVAAPVLLVLVGGFTALFASVVLTTQPTVKVALGYSSAAHMGFMLLVCGLGVYPAAILHLVAHSFYKAHAFLSSGSVVESARAAHVRLPPRLRSPARVALTVLFAGGVYAGLAWVLGFDPEANPALLVVGGILVMGLAQLLAPALDAASSVGALARTGLMALAVGVAFFTLEETFRLLLEPTVPGPSAPEPLIVALGLVVLFTFGVAVAVQIFQPKGDSAFARALYVHLRNGLYANAVFDRLVGALRTPRSSRAA